MVVWLENYVSNPYLRSLIVLILVFVILKIVIFFIEKIVLNLTSKTATKVDDLFAKKASKPITVGIILIGFRMAIEELPLSAGVLDIIGNIIFSLILICASFVIYYFIDVVLFFAIKKTIKGNNSSARTSLINLLQSITKALLFALILLYILDFWGVQIGPFLAAMGIAGLAVALALQPALSNIFSGISIVIDKSIKVGDLIYLDADTKGKVVYIGLRSTKILTFDNEMIIVPNTKLADSKIQNVAEPDPKARVVIQFSVAYGSDIRKVKKIVLSEVKKVKGFVDDPAPVVRFTEMGQSSLNFKAYFHVDNYEIKWSAIDEANTRIYDSLEKNKIKIPFPQLDIRIKEFNKRDK